MDYIPNVKKWQSYNAMLSASVHMKKGVGFNCLSANKIVK